MENIKVVNQIGEDGGLSIEVNSLISGLLLNVEYINCTDKDIQVCFKCNHVGSDKVSRPIVPFMDIECAPLGLNKELPVSKMLVYCCPVDSRIKPPKDWNAEIRLTVFPKEI